MGKEKSVLTKKELIKNKSTDSKGEVKKTSPLKKKIIQKKFECSFAPPGESSVSFVHTYKGEQTVYKLNLMNKIYTLPDNLEKADEERYRQALKDNGFMDITVIDAGGVAFDVKKGKYYYKVIHPEHTAKNRINGTISLALQDNAGRPICYEKGDNKGKQISKQVNIIEGLVITDDELIYEALLKAGFYNAGKRIKED